MSHRVPPTFDDVDTLLPIETPRWFILRTMGGQEARALFGLRELFKRPEIKPLGLGVYLPRETRWCRGGGPKRRTRQALVPGYMFVQATPAVFHLVTQVDGVIGFLCLAHGPGVAGVPAVAPLPFVGGLAWAEAFGDFDLTRSKAKYKAGDKVKVEVGSFAGWPGKVLATEPDGRVRVLLQSMLGKEHEKLLAEADLKVAA